MTETYEVITSLRTLLTHIQKQQQNGKLDENVRRALQVFAEDIQSLLSHYIHDSRSKHEWARLFCQRVQRIHLKYKYVNEPEWQRRREMIGYLLSIDGEQSIYSNDPIWVRFLNIMDFEKALKERMALSMKRVGGRINRNKRLVQNYLRKCISLHCKIKTHYLNITTRDILKRLSLYTEESNLTKEQILFLDQELGSLDISLNCFYQQFKAIPAEENKETDINSRTFIPSIIVEKNSNTGTRLLENILRSDRWIMLLGAPGSGKSSLLRWLTVQYAYSAVEGFKSVYLNETEIDPVRIPILIRIGEFMEWLTKYPSATLFDYIGYQTWLGERYMSEEHEAILKYIVYQGRALILLDGFDEVSTFEQEVGIRHLVSEFISKYVRSYGQVSAFDDTALVRIENEYIDDIGKANQIIMSSRQMEYELHRWNSGAIEHYFLSPLTKNESIHFGNHWANQVEGEIIRRAAANGITFETSKHREKVLSSNVLTVLQKIFDEDNKHWTEHTLYEQIWIKQYRSKHVISLPAILSLVCSGILSKGTWPSQKIKLYHDCVHSAMPIWISSCAISTVLSENILNQILSHLAYYLHRKSISGLIDEFDLKRFCNVSLRMIHGNSTSSFSNRLALISQTEACMRMLNSNVDIAVVSNLGAYGFLHLAFQEYFAALALTTPLREANDSYNTLSSLSLIKIATQFIEHILAPSFREPLVLALSLVGWQLTPVDFDLLCCELLDCKKSSIPLGALLLLESVDSLVTLPSKTTLFRAFHSLIILDYSTVFDSTLRRALADVILSNNWLSDYLSCETDVESFCKLVMRLTEIPKKGLDDIAQNTVWGDETKLALPKWMTPIFTQQLYELLNILPNEEYILDQTLRRINMLQDGSICMCKCILQQYLLEKKVSIWKLHPTVIALIIGVYGGLYRYRGIDDLLLKFIPQCMYRDSILSSLLIEYIDQNIGSGYMENIQPLIIFCEQRIKIISPSDVTLDAVDLMVALICLRGLKKPSEFFIYSSYGAFPIAIQRFKRILFYLRQIFVCVKGEATLFSKWIHSVISDFFDTSKRNENDIREFLESIGISFVRLTQTTNPVLLRENVWWKVKPACVRLSTKMGTIEMNDFLSRAPCIIRLLCSSQSYSSWTTLFKKTLRTMFDTGSNYKLLAFVPRSMHSLYERLIVTGFLKIPDVDKSGQKLSFVFFLYQNLRYIEEKINFRLRPLILSLLEPVLTKYGFTSYMIALLDDLRNQMSVDLKCYPQFVELSMPNRVQAAISEERRRIEHIVAVNTEKSHDEELFTSAICLMRLCRKYQANEVFNDICSAVITIKDIILRSLAITSIWYLTDRNQLENKLRKVLLNNMFLCFDLLSADESPLIISLLLVHSFSMKHAFEVRYNALLQSLNETSLSIEDIQAIYAALSDNLGDIFIPSTAMIDYQQRTSVAISRCLVDDTFWSSNRHSGKTILFASLYLTELSVDAQVLRYFCSTQNIKVHSFSSESLSTEILTYFDALKLLESYPKTDSALTSVSDIQLQNISIQLCYGEYTIAEAQQLFKQLKDYFRLYLFIQRDCLLLTKKGIFTPFIIHTICASLEDLDEKLRQQSTEIFNHPLLIPFEINILHVLMDNALNYVDKSLFHYASMLHHRMKIIRLEDLQILLQVEYDRFHMKTNTSHRYRQLCFLSFIGQCAKDVLHQFIEHIHSLILALRTLTNTETSQFEYVINLIRYGVHFLIRRRSNILESVTLFTEDPTYRQFLIDLLKTSQIVPIQEIAAQVLAEVIRPVFIIPNKEFQKQIMIVHEIFWQIITEAATKDDQCKYSNKVLIISLCSLNYRYIQQPAPQFSLDKSAETVLTELHKNHKSSFVQDRLRSLLALYYLTNYGQEGLLRRFDMNVEVTYRLLMYSLQDENGHVVHRPYTERKISSLITDYPNQLLSLFVDDFQCFITSDADHTLHQKYPAHIRIAVELINTHLLKKYCQIIRMGILGEFGFLKALRTASKKWISNCQKEVLIIAVAFGNLTWYVVDFILEVALRLDNVNTEQAFVAFINEVSEREAIEYVLVNLRASSMIQRYLMGELLVQLVLKDIVSPLEIVNELIDTINDPTSQLILKHASLGSNVTLSEEMLRLFKRLICIVPPTTPIKEFRHFISQQIIEHDFCTALNAFNDAFFLLSNETD